MTLILSILLNTVNYFIGYKFVSQTTVLLLLLSLIIIPAFYNGFLYIRDQRPVNILLLPLITTFSYYFVGRQLEAEGIMKSLSEKANQLSGDLIVNVSETLVAPSQIITVFFIQAAVILCIYMVLIRSKKDDRSHKFKQKVYEGR